MREHKATILIADDDPLILNMIIDVLSADGYHLLVARDGAEAIQLATTNQPDLMLVDVVMPEVGGYEVIQALREREPERDWPIIFLSAQDQEAQIGAAFDVGALDYITKPFSPGNLRTRVRTWLLRLSSGAESGSPLPDAPGATPS
jgi:putative two-component system response regulator